MSFEVALVCMNGHMVNDSFQSSPEFNENHCQKCGAKTTTSCPSCKALIKGDFKSSVVVLGRATPTPTHCHNCGAAYPWKSKVEKARKKMSAKGKMSLTDKFKGSAFVAVIAMMLGAISYLGNWWDKLPADWRAWLVQNVPQLQIKMPERSNTKSLPNPDSSKASETN
jgi:hypothetical protein